MNIIISFDEFLTDELKRVISKSSKTGRTIETDIIHDDIPSSSKSLSSGILLKDELKRKEEDMTKERAKTSGEEKTLTAKAPVAETPKTTPGYLEIIVITILIVGGAIWGYDQFFAQKILTFDLSGYLREQTTLIKAGQMTEEQFKSNLDRTEALLGAVAEKRRHVILLKDVVMRNGNEISHE